MINFTDLQLKLIIDLFVHTLDDPKSDMNLTQR